MTDSTDPSSDDLISIPLHTKHWIAVLGALDGLAKNATKRIDELKKQGVDHTTLPHATITALTAPMIARGIIVKELTNRGVMTPEANQQFGIDRIMDEIRKYRNDI